jgi:hypothetical protein
MYPFKLVMLSFLFILLFVNACSINDKNLKKDKIDKITTNGNFRLKAQENPSSEQEIKQPVTRVSTWKDNKIHKIEYNLSKDGCKGSSLIAPSYVDNKRIIFLSYGEKTDTIYEFLRDKQTCQSIYKAKGISNITGVNGKLFWSEYDTTKFTNVDWIIKSLELLNGKVNVVESGRSYEDTPPPTIRADKDSVNWIEYELKGKTVISKLMKYDLLTNNKSELSKGMLDESKTRNGEYYINQQGSQNKYLLYKSIFKSGEKNFNISLYEDGHLEQSLINEDKVIDFINNEKYFSYTNEGSLIAFDLNNPNTKITFETGNHLTTDTPIFLNTNTLVFRSAMNELFILNLQNKLYYSITDYQDLVSKPIFTNGLLSYAVKSKENEKEKLSFFVVNIN